MGLARTKLILGEPGVRAKLYRINKKGQRVNENIDEKRPKDDVIDPKFALLGTRDVPRKGVDIARHMHKRTFCRVQATGGSHESLCFGSARIGVFWESPND